MAEFGFSIARARSIDMDSIDKRNILKMEEIVPSFKRCINCGACSATCTSGHFTQFNIRKTHSLYRRGQYKELAQELEKCMLCGKCTLTCPRGVNLRAMVISMRKILLENL